MNEALQHTPSLVLPLDAAEATLERVGGKGASLARLARAGLPVPPGFHITTAAYSRFVTANALQGAIAEASQAGAEDPAALDRASVRIQGLFTAGAMPEDVAQAIRRSYADMAESGESRDVAVAVRSSATAEDLPEMSFAGQHESYLNVRGEAAVLEAVKRCWGSLWTARAIGYRARHGIAPDEISLAVVVQQLVPADAAGVLFTADPISGRRDRMLVNAAWGLGEALVSGMLTPDSLTLDSASGTILSEQVADKAVMTALTAEGTSTEDVPEEQRRRAVLTPRQAAELARLGARIEELYGQPMDIEWARHGRQISILQARPITALPEPPAIVARPPDALSEAEWPVPNPQAKYYRASVVELLPDPLSPLFATLALPRWSAALVDMIEEFGANRAARDFAHSYVLTTINGYAFYEWRFRPSQIPGLFAIMIQAFPVILRARERWEYDARPTYAAVADRWKAEDLVRSPAGRLLSGVREITAVAARHYLTIQSGILPVAYFTELVFTSVYDRVLKGRGDPPALTFLLGFDSAPIRAERSLYELARWAAGRKDLAAYLTAATGAQLASILEGPAPAGVEKRHWQELGRRFASHLAEFGHTIYDLDFAKPVPADDPAPLLDTLRHLIRGHGVDPGARQAAAAAERHQATRAMQRKLGPLRRAIFRWLLPPAQRYAPLREDALAEAGLGWPVLRRILLELGSRLVNTGALDRAEDVFWLTEGELGAATAALDEGRVVEGHQALVAERRATWRAQRRLTPPVALPLRGATTIFGMDWSRFMPARTEQAEGGLIHGIGTSPGRVTGTARVLHGPEEFALMQPGDILVARITTPAWTPLFALAAGIVTDVGGPLSHGSIVAREYHIPAVLGTAVATERIHSGQRITVDGDSGTVQLLE